MLKKLMSLTRRKEGAQRARRDLKLATRFGNFWAAVIDFFLVGVVRLAFLVCLAFWANEYRLELIDGIKTIYGGMDNFNITRREHFEYFINSRYATSMFVGVIVVIAMGCIYRAVMWLSPWHATIGQRAMKIMLVKNGDDGNDKVELFDVTSRVMMVYIVWLFPILIVAYWSTKKYLSILFLVLTSIWNDASFLFGKKVTFPDAITGTVCVYGVEGGSWAELGRWILSPFVRGK